MVHAAAGFRGGPLWNKVTDLTMTALVSLDELEAALDLASNGCDAYVSRATGHVCWNTPDFSLAEAFPDDADDPTLIPVPSARDLDLGRRLVSRFAQDEAPDWADDINACFARKGAYARFNALLERAGLLDRWQAYRAAARRAALTAWAEEEGFVVGP